MDNQKHQIWNEWAAKAQSGDKNAYALLLRDIIPYIKIVLSPSLANPDWVDDITQEVLISVHKSLKTYAPSKSFKPWLNAIISFRKADFLRSHYAQKKKIEESAAAQGDVQENDNVTKLPYAGELKDIEAALDALPEKQRAVFTKVRIEGYTVSDVAQEMDMSVSAVKVSVHRTAKKLQDILSE